MLIPGLTQALVSIELIVAIIRAIKVRCVTIKVTHLYLFIYDINIFMRNKFVYFIFFFMLIGCKKEKKTVIYETAPYQLLNADIITTMPGNLLIAGKYLVWENPFARDYFISVHEANTGKKIGVMGKVGEGPEEFVTGGLRGSCIDNKLFATDANGNTQGYLSIDSLIQHKKTFIALTDSERILRSSMAEIEKGVFVGNTENGDADYFKASINGRDTTFGVYPIETVKRHVGGYMAYDSISGLLAYCSFNFPYLSLYKRVKDSFSLQWERKSEKGYEIVKDRVKFDRKIGGVFGVCLSKDYIITLERDRTKEPIDESTVGRDASKCPHTVFLYDYNAQLIKIVDLGIPVMRIAADRSSNTLYAIGVDPDFVLVKYEL